MSWASAARPNPANVLAHAQESRGGFGSSFSFPVAAYADTFDRHHDGSYDFPAKAF
jgi:hypothetical protein